MSLNNTSEDMTEDSGRKGGDYVSPKTSVVQSIQARKNARRSTIFRKDAPSSVGTESDNLPSSSPISYQDSDIKSSDSTSSKGTQDHQDQPRISLSDYEKALQTEKEEWSCTRRARSERYHKLNTKLKSRSFDSITMESCTNLLSCEDRKFMSERPKYVQIANCARDLKEEIIIAMGIKKSKVLGANAILADFTKTLEVLDWEVANLD